MEAYLNINLKIKKEGVYVVNEPPAVTTIGLKDLIESNKGMNFQIATGATDSQVALAPVDNARLIYILTTETISVKKNSSGGEAWTIAADRILSSDKKLGVLVVTTADIDSLYFSNASGQTADITLIYAN